MAQQKAGYAPFLILFLLIIHFAPLAYSGQSADHHYIQLAELKTTANATQQTDLRAKNHYVDGIKAFNVKDYDTAAQSFKKAIELDPGNLEFQYYLGIAYARLKRDQEAIEIFNFLIEKDPVRFFIAYLDIAMIYNNQGKYQAALDTLNLAEQKEPGNANIFLEKGNVYKNLGDYDQAIESLKRAGALDPKMTQMAYYMMGSTYLEEEKFDRADQMFRESVAVNPQTPLAKTAQEAISQVEMIAWIRKPWYLVTSFDWGYDDNVARDPLQEITGGPVTGGTGKGDQFQTFQMRAGYKFLNRKDLEAGVGYTLFSLGYRDWTDSNVTSHSPHIYIQGNYDPVLFRFQYDFSYFYSGGKKQGINPPLYLTFANNSYARLRMHSFMPTITILEPYDLRTDFNFSYQIKNYLDGVSADASRYGGDITQSYKIPGTDCYPRIGYRHVYEQSGDDPATYRYNEFFVGVSSAIYWGIWGDLSFGYMRTDYPEFSSNKSRKDSTYTMVFSLNRTFFDRLMLSFTYIHLKNDSDYLENGKDLYTFRKNVYTLSITYTF